MVTRPPRWFRMDTDYAENVKLLQLKHQRRFGAIALWTESLAYSVRHLTDGMVPTPLPKRWGYRACDTKHLVDVGLWIPLEYGDYDGWLINDFLGYQVTKEEWLQMSERQRKNAQKRWTG